MADEAFFQAASNGDVKEMQSKLAAGADVNWSCSSSFGNTPLMMACVNGQHAAVHFLLENGASPNVVATGGYTAAHRACFWGREEFVLALFASEQKYGRVDAAMPEPCFLVSALDAALSD